MVAGRRDVQPGSRRRLVAATPQDEWPEDPEERAESEHDCAGEYGDRRQVLVLTGIGMDEAALQKKLEACLLTDAKWRRGAKAWRYLPDPLAPWDDEEEVFDDAASVSGEAARS